MPTTDRNAPEYRWSLAERIAGRMLEAGLSHRDVHESTSPDDLIDHGALSKPEASYIRSLSHLPDHEARDLFVKHAKGTNCADDPDCAKTFNYFRQLVWINLYSRPEEEEVVPG